MNNRDKSLDAIKAVLIFLVVFGHSIERLAPSTFVFIYLYSLIYIFHMPAFIYISGYLSKTKKTFPEIFKSLIYPYIVLEILYAITDVYLFKKPFDLNFAQPNWGMWYLVSLATWRLATPLVAKHKLTLYVFLGISIGVGFFEHVNSTLSLSRTLVYYPFFLLGYFQTDYKLTKNKIFSYISLTSIFVCLIALYYNPNFIPRKILWASSPYDVSSFFMLGPASRVLHFFLALCFLDLLTKVKIKGNQLLYRIGQGSLIVFAFHFLIIRILIYLNFSGQIRLLEASNASELLVLLTLSCAITYILTTPIIYVNAKKVISPDTFQKFKRSRNFKD